MAFVRLLWCLPLCTDASHQIVIPREGSHDVSMQVFLSFGLLWEQTVELLARGRDDRTGRLNTR